MAVLDLNRDKWKEFKTANNLSKSSIFKKADVGPAIDKFQSAVDAFKKSRGKKDFSAVFSKSQDLKKAFEKFVKLKETKGELTAPAKAKIEKWAQQLESVSTQLAQLYAAHKDELLENDANAMVDTFNELFPF